VIALSPPPLDLWRRLDADLISKRGKIATARARLDDENIKLRQAQNELSALAHGGALPDDAALARARAHRDTGWRLIYRRAFTSSPPSAAEEQAFTADVPLPLAFERAMTAADAIADQRAADSGVLGQIEAARHAFANSQQHAEAAAERYRLALEALTQTHRAWAQLCGALTLEEDATLAHVQAFSAWTGSGDRRHGTPCSRGRRTAFPGTASAQLGDRAREYARRSTIQPSAASRTGDPNLVRGIRTTGRHAANSKQDELRRRRNCAMRWRGKSWRINASLPGTERWRAVLTELGRPEDEEPAETETVLQTLNEIEKELRDSTSLTERVTGMTAEIERFRLAVEDLRRTLPGLTTTADPFDAVRDFGRLLNDERGRDQRRRLLRDNLEKSRAAAASTTQDLAAAQARLTAILSVIGAESKEAATDRLTLSDQRAGLRGPDAPRPKPRCEKREMATRSKNSGPKRRPVRRMTTSPASRPPTRNAWKPPTPRNAQRKRRAGRGKAWSRKRNKATSSRPPPSSRRPWHRCRGPWMKPWSITPHR